MLLDNKKNYSKDNHLKHLKYRPDVDGLRAIAVLSVLGYHLFPTQFPSGYIGVDIFFVISGYLITNIILSSLDNGSFSIKDFYIKRIKRIFPALAIVLLMSIIYGWFNLFPSEYALLGKHVAAGSAFIANIALWRDSGYFDPVSELNPLLHLWSLGIEEQFYLIWPIVLILIFNLGKRYVLVALILITIVSFSSNVAMVNNKPIATFFLPFTRMWELLIGAFLAFHVWSESRILYSLGIYLRVQDNITFQKKCLNILSILGLSLLVVAFLLINHSNTPFPGFWALLPTVGAALIIAGGPYAWFNYNILASRILVAVGLISYPLYLVHWPVLSFSRIEFGEPDLLGSIVIACISTFLAWLIYKFIEKPLRNSKRGSIPILLLVIVGVIGIYGVLTYKGWISNDRESEQFNFVRKFEETKPQFLYLKENPLYEAYRIDCDFLNVTTEKAKDSINKSCFTSNAEKSIFIWGDSHAQQLNYGLKKLLPVDISILQVATSGCSPSLNKISRDVYGACNKSNQFAM
jgi:peptidoglycan/LPS O-acetylase OafA/YrhL